MSARPRSARFVAALVIIPVLAAACGSNDAPTPTTSSSPTSSSSSVVTSSSATVTSEPTTTTATPVPTETTPAAPVLDPLTGNTTVSPNVVVAAKIENNFSGRQFGVAQADVVYVEMVEAQLSRLIAVFHTTLPNEVGPVRSVRTTDPDVLTAYGKPALVFSGGAGGPLDNFAASGLVDASIDRYPGLYFNSSAASSPYKVHTNMAKVVATVPGISTPNSPGFTFGGDYPAMAAGRSVSSISAAFQISVKFTAKGADYAYVRAGKAAVDADGTAVTMQNVLVQHVQAEPDGNVDVNGVKSFKSHSIGSGTFTLYRDGKAIDGNWSRPDAGSPTSYLDPSGAPVLFKPGKTWVVLAPSMIRVSEG